MAMYMLNSRGLEAPTAFIESSSVKLNFNKISRQIYKKGFSAKISTMKTQNFYTIKIASTKATVWLENDFAIFWQHLRRA